MRRSSDQTKVLQRPLAACNNFRHARTGPELASLAVTWTLLSRAAAAVRTWRVLSRLASSYKRISISGNVCCMQDAIESATVPPLLWVGISRLTNGAEDMSGLRAS